MTEVPYSWKFESKRKNFEGRVTKKFPTRIVIEFERMIYSKKYERYYKSKTKIHAHFQNAWKMKSTLEI